MARALSQELIQQIRTLRTQGVSVANIAKAVGRNVTTVSKYSLDIPSQLRQFISPEQITTMREMRTQGATLDAIGKRLNLCSATVLKYCGDIKRVPKYTAKQIARMRRLRTEGLSYAKIALEMEMPATTVVEFVRDIHVTRPEPVSPEEQAEMVELHAQGWSFKRIAQHMHRSPGAVRTHVPHCCDHRPHVTYPEETHDKAIIRYMQGMTVPQIAEELRIPRSPIYGWVRQYTPDVPKPTLKPSELLFLDKRAKAKAQAEKQSVIQRVLAVLAR